jgi:hypothetical protein
MEQLVVRKDIDLNEHDGLSNITLRHKLRNDDSICKITSPVSMSGTMMTVFVRLLHLYLCQAQ